MPEPVENDIHSQMRSAAIEGDFDRVHDLIEDGADVKSLNQVCITVGWIFTTPKLCFT